MKKNLLESARHLVVEGPIGVGKTSLARRLGEYLDAELLLEQPETNPFLSRFYQNQERYALQTQLFFLFHRLELVRDLAQPELFPRTVVSDFLLEKDPLFAALTLNEDEYTLYRQIYDRVSLPASVAPDLVIYLQARPETLVSRVRKRGIDMERKISDDYLILLGESYTRFFHNYELAPVLVVNSENLDFVDSTDDFQLLVQRIESMRGHREYFNRGD
ncbi:MAG: deoxynucleoside kinase [Propionivibrio sp.]|uniref:Deoxynucleoside kinase n=1 Tax=Candidatus Propionivibrio dominans TaxID=2954373 RepID=A0A9D7I8G1_9RHOO|nr:deoxynucleoside kinase [Candidatus Propionivibrio dominans]